MWWSFFLLLTNIRSESFVLYRGVSQKPLIFLSESQHNLSFDMRKIPKVKRMMAINRGMTVNSWLEREVLKPWGKCVGTLVHRFTLIMFAPNSIYSFYEPNQRNDFSINLHTKKKEITNEKRYSCSRFTNIFHYRKSTKMVINLKTSRKTVLV